MRFINYSICESITKFGFLEKHEAVLNCGRTVLHWLLNQLELNHVYKLKNLIGQFDHLNAIDWLKNLE